MGSQYVLLWCSSLTRLLQVDSSAVHPNNHMTIQRADADHRQTENPVFVENFRAVAAEADFVVVTRVVVVSFRVRIDNLVDAKHLLEESVLRGNTNYIVNITKYHYLFSSHLIR